VFYNTEPKEKYMKIDNLCFKKGLLKKPACQSFGKKQVILTVILISIKIHATKGIKLFEQSAQQA